jgi:hypothetical protein
VPDRSDPPSDAGIGIAMITFLVVLFGIVMAIHFLQPEGRETATSSASPSHQQGRK